MPWTVIARIIFGLVAWRFVRSRQKGEPMVNVEQLRGRVGSVREPVSIVAHLITTVVLSAFTGAIVTAGITVATHSPKWLGYGLLGISAIFGIAALQELIKLRREVAARRRRRQTRELTRELDQRRYK
jgi:hypothetical protein